MAKEDESGSSQESAGFMDSIKKAYFSVEDVYYSFMDALDKKVGIPVYKFFVDPIENSGVPSFPFAVLLLALLAFGLFSVFFAQGSATVTLSLKSAESGAPINGARVTLSVDDKLIGPQQSANGVVTFDGVPLGKPVTVKVEAENYLPFSRQVEPFSADAKEQTIRLDPVPPKPAPKFTVFVVDNLTLPVFGATVIAASMDGSPIGLSQATDARGMVQIPLQKTDPFYLTVQKAGYEKILNKLADPSAALTATIALRPLQDCDGNNCSVEEKKVRVIVRVRNSTGDPVQGEVTLTSDSGKNFGTMSIMGGQAVFNNIAKGTRVAYTVTPTGADAGRYKIYLSTEPVAAGNDTTEISVVMESKPPASSGPVAIHVQDESSKPLKDADVTLYSELSNTFYGKNKTNAGGSTSFDLSIGTLTYATVYLAGYFPAKQNGLVANSNSNVTLRKVRIGSFGNINVQVVDFDGATPVKSATVNVLASDEYFAGYPQVTTNADGKAAIPNLALGNYYRLLVAYGSKKGKSALFQPVEGENLTVLVTLDPTMATLVLNAKDSSNNQNIEATGTVLLNGIENGSCQMTAASQYSCSVPVQANVPITVKMTAPGYEQFVSVPLVLSTSETKAYSGYLLPSRFKNDFYLYFLGLADSQSNNVSLIDKGGYYDAKFVVHFPANASSAKGGFIARVGNVGREGGSALDAQEKFVIKSAGSSGNEPQPPFFSYSYTPSPSCSVDLQRSQNDQDNYKWVSYTFDSVGAGSREISVRIFVKPNATSQDKLELSYKAWLAVTNTSYVHLPEDQSFGSNFRSSTRDWCYAAANKAVYTVAIGRSFCTEDACISLDFSDGNATYGSTYFGTVGSEFRANIDIRTFRPMQSPRLSVSSPGKQVGLHQYSVESDAGPTLGDALGAFNFTTQMFPFSSHANGSVVAVPVIPVSASSFTVELSDSGKVVATATGSVSVQGSGLMSITVKPEKMTAGDAYDLEVRLFESQSGRPVTTATVSFNETSGSPFGGEVPASVVGGSVNDPSQGYNGIYTIESVSPASRGAFEVIATHPDFVTVRKEISVNTTNFLSAIPADFSVCGGEQSVQLQNSIDLNSTVLLTSNCTLMTTYFYSQNEYQYGVPPVWYNATNEVLFDAFTSSWSFSLPGKRLGLVGIKPRDWGLACTMVIAAQARDGSSAVRTIPYKNCDRTAANNFLSISPSELVNSADSGSACNLAHKITITNNVTAYSKTTIPVTLQGPGLRLESAGTNISLDAPYQFEMALASSTDFVIAPTQPNKSFTLSASSLLDDGRSASVVIPFKNCEAVTCQNAPAITSYAPNGEDVTGSSVKVTVVNTIDTSCNVGNVLCKIDVNAVPPEGMRWTFAPSASVYLHEMELTVEGATEEPPLVVGDNSYYAACCNPSENGGQCGNSVNVKFNYGGAACKSSGVTCNSTVANDCCAGLSCITATGATDGVCGIQASPLPPTPTPVPPIPPVPPGPGTPPGGCTGDSQCTDPGFPACYIPAGSTTGGCQECTPTSHKICDNFNPVKVCDEKTLRCVAAPAGSVCKSSENIDTTTNLNNACMALVIPTCSSGTVSCSDTTGVAYCDETLAAKCSKGTIECKVASGTAPTPACDKAGAPYCVGDKCSASPTGAVAACDPTDRNSKASDGIPDGTDSECKTSPNLVCTDEKKCSECEFSLNWQSGTDEGKNDACIKLYPDLSKLYCTSNDLCVECDNSLNGATGVNPACSGSTPYCSTGNVCSPGSGGIPARKAEDKTINFTFTDTGVEVAYANGTKTDNVHLGISSLTPAAGFRINIVNKKSTEDTIETFISPPSTQCLQYLRAEDGVAYPDGTPVYTRKGETSRLIAIYPSLDGGASPHTCTKYESSTDPNDPKRMLFSIPNKEIELLVGFGLRLDDPGILKVNLDEIDTDQFTLGGAIFSGDIGPASLGTDPKEFVHYYVDSNNKQTIVPGDAPSGSGKRPLIYFPNLLVTDILLKDFSYVSPIEQVFTDLSVYPTSVKVTGSSYNVRLTDLSLDPQKLITPTLSKAYTDPKRYQRLGVFSHTDLKNLFDSSTQELYNLKTALDKLPDETKGSATPVVFVPDPVGLLHYKSGADFKIRIPVIEGGNTRILNFKGKGDDFSFEPAKDVTGTYEYGVLEKGFIPGSYYPNVRQFAAPGQKNGTAFYWPVSNNDPASCGEACDYGTSLYSQEGAELVFSGAKIFPYSSSPDFSPCSGKPLKINEKDNCVAAGDSDSYCNFAAERVENNPRICCESGFSRNGQCVEKVAVGSGAGNENCFLSTDGRVKYYSYSSGSSTPTVFSESTAQSVTLLTLEEYGSWSSGTLTNPLTGVAHSGLGAGGVVTDHGPTGCASDQNCKTCFVGEDCAAKTSSAAGTSSCKNSNYYGNKPDSGKGYQPFYLLNPGARCVTFKPVGWAGKDPSCQSCAGVGSSRFTNSLVCKPDETDCYFAIGRKGTDLQDLSDIDGFLTRFDSLMSSSSRDEINSECLPKGAGTYVASGTVSGLSCSSPNFSPVCDEDRGAQNLVYGLALGSKVFQNDDRTLERSDYVYTVTAPVFAVVGVAGVIVSAICIVASGGACGGALITGAAWTGAAASAALSVTTIYNSFTLGPRKCSKDTVKYSQLTTCSLADDTLSACFGYTPTELDWYKTQYSAVESNGPPAPKAQYCGSP